MLCIYFDFINANRSIILKSYEQSKTSRLERFPKTENSY